MSPSARPGTRTEIGFGREAEIAEDSELAVIGLRFVMHNGYCDSEGDSKLVEKRHAPAGTRLALSGWLNPVGWAKQIC